MKKKQIKWLQREIEMSNLRARVKVLEDLVSQMVERFVAPTDPCVSELEAKLQASILQFKERRASRIKEAAESD